MQQSAIRLRCRRSPLSRALAIAFLVVGSNAVAGDGVWTYNGPDGGFVRTVLAHPGTTLRAYAFDSGGIFRTNDGGVSWQRIQSGLPPELAVSAIGLATTGNVMYLESRGSTYRSTDAGSTWLATAGAPAGLVFATSMDVSPIDADRVVIAGGNRVWTTSNGGASWIAAPALAADVEIASVKFGLGGVLIAALRFPSGAYGDATIIRSSDSGVTWIAGAPIPGIFGAQVMRRSPADAQRLWLTDFSQLATSSDGGLSGVAVTVPGNCQPSSVEPMPAPAAGVVVTCRTGGLMRSNDALAASPVWTAIGQPQGFVNYGTEPAISHLVALDASYPATDNLLAALGGGLLRSTDNGSSWTAANTGLQEQLVRAIAMHPSDNRVALIGMSDGANNGSPLWKSVDTQATWTLASTDLSADWIRTIAIDTASTSGGPIIIDPDPFTAYAAGLSFPPPLGAPAPYNVRNASIMKTSNGGATWVPMDTGIATTGPTGAMFTNMGTVRTITLDPRSCAVPPASGPCLPGSGSLSRLWVGGTGVVNRAAGTTGNYTSARVYRSLNGAGNWTASENGLPPAQLSTTVPPQVIATSFVVPIVVHPNDSNILYLGTGVSNDPSTVPTIVNGVFKSVDGGVNWTHSSNGLPRYAGAGTPSHLNVLSLAITPSNPNVLYASVNDLLSGMAVSAIYKSIDAGANWSNASTGIGGADVRALLVDPADPTGNTVYAGLGASNAANPGAVYRTIDGGANWNAYSLGLPGGSALSLAIARRLPGEQARLIAGTSSGVWEFTVPVDPDSDAVGVGMEASVNGGDGDGDGVPDSGQANVASFSGSTNIAAVRQARGSPTVLPITIDVVSGCAQVNNATRYDADQYPLDTQNPQIDHSDYGLVRVELPNCRAAIVDVIFHGANFAPLQWSWRNYGPRVPGDETTFGWYGFAGAQQISNNTWRLSLNVNELGNYRNDGLNILFLGGPTRFPQALFSNGFD